ncbi:hypothetical protein L208DRAFT_105586 [Tricholoma matsutake]|nr:hypothetical protein L208DRAFT_105586 [Tricholoma matsutake 945]
MSPLFQQLRNNSTHLHTSLQLPRVLSIPSCIPNPPVHLPHHHQQRWQTRLQHPGNGIYGLIYHTDRTHHPVEPPTNCRQLVFVGPVCRTEKKTKTELNWTY